MSCKKQVAFRLDPKVLEILDKHFPDNRSAGIEHIIRKFDNDYFTLAELKHLVVKFTKKESTDSS